MGPCFVARPAYGGWASKTDHSNGDRRVVLWKGVPYSALVWALILIGEADGGKNGTLMTLIGPDLHQLRSSASSASSACYCPPDLTDKGATGA
jgi:hypothetical protein